MHIRDVLIKYFGPDPSAHSSYNFKIRQDKTSFILEEFLWQICSVYIVWINYIYSSRRCATLIKYVLTHRNNRCGPLNLAHLIFQELLDQSTVGPGSKTPKIDANESLKEKLMWRNQLDHFTRECAARCQWYDLLSDLCQRRLKTRSCHLSVLHTALCWEERKESWKVR